MTKKTIEKIEQELGCKFVEKHNKRYWFNLGKGTDLIIARKVFLCRNDKYQWEELSKEKETKLKTILWTKKSVLRQLSYK